MSEQVLAELWVSLVSLVRSYAAAHDLGQTANHSSIKEAAGSLNLEASGNDLLIEFDPQSGDGKWTLNGTPTGMFHVGLDSMVEFSDRRGKLELEIAAEAFTAKVFDEA